MTQVDVIKIDLGTETFTPVELVEDIIFSLKYYTKVNGMSPEAREIKATLQQIAGLLTEAANAMD